MSIVARAVIGALLGAAIAFAGHRARALTWSGAVAAAIVGMVAVAAGWGWAFVLITYFGISSALSRIGARRKQALVAGVVDKTGARDATQVMANGFPFLFFALVAIVARGNVVLWTTCAFASLAASAGDTWATEIGTLVGHTPRSILSWRRMSVGESGGVTIPGWIAAAAGAAFVGGAALLAGVGTAVFPSILIGGLAGAFADSLAGATIQRRAWCDACGRATEMRTHDCGAATRHTGGFAWLENDGVNLLATTTGALTPLVIHAIGASGIAT